jgi:phosphomannomutase/phosphoglucomutase
MTFPTHVFREYDVRGVADRDLGDDLAERLGLAYATMLGKAPRVALARDCRLSSPRLHAAILKGLLAAGAQVIDVGVGPTPLLYFAANHLATDGALMITGSHNPGDENGFKMMRGLAPFYGDDIRTLRDRVQAGGAGPGGGTVTSQSVEEAYLTALVERSGPHRPLKVVLDAGNGSGGPLALKALRAAGLEVEPLYCEMDGHFPNHHPDPTQPENLTELIRRVKASGAALGLALDGDADRLGAVDENGEIIWGDKLLVIFARAILKTHPGAAVVGEVKCSQTTYDDIAKHGGRPILWKTGHSLIKTKMKEEHALLAGEMSGHLFFADRWFGFDDAIYGALRLTAIVSEAGAKLSPLLADLPRTAVTPELREECPDAVKFDVVAAILAKYRKTHEVVDVDGARILFGDGAWGLVRASNTQPVLVLRFEAKTEARRDELRAEVEAAVREERARHGA